MNFLLRLKHWQLFLLLIGIPLLIQIVGLTAMLVTRGPAAIFLAFPLIMILYIGVFFSWFYAMGTNLNKKLPDTVKMNLKKFKFFLSIPVVYILFICVFIFGQFSGLFYVLNGVSTNVSPYSQAQPDFSIFLLIFPLHFFSIYCLFYCLYFIAKSLKAVELQRPVEFSDYSGEFFLIWFFIIGVWILQPRINRLFAEDGASTNSEKG